MSANVARKQVVVKFDGRRTNAESLAKTINERTPFRATVAGKP